MPMRIAVKYTPELNGTTNHFRDLCNVRLGKKLQEKEDYNPFIPSLPHDPAKGIIGACSAGTRRSTWNTVKARATDRKFANAKTVSPVLQMNRAHAATLEAHDHPLPLPTGRWSAPPLSARRCSCSASP